MIPAVTFCCRVRSIAKPAAIPIGVAAGFFAVQVYFAAALSSAFACSSASGRR